MLSRGVRIDYDGLAALATAAELRPHVIKISLRRR
jgi:hypothetical protein